MNNTAFAKRIRIGCYFHLRQMTSALQEAVNFDLLIGCQHYLTTISTQVRRFGAVPNLERVCLINAQITTKHFSDSSACATTTQKQEHQ